MRVSFCAPLYAAGLLGPDGVILGRFGRDYLRHDGPEHVLCVAPTRSGKGVGLVIPTLLTWPGSAIVHDIKGENWQLTAGWRARFGRVLLFDPTNALSAAYNPLFEVRRGDTEVRDVQNVADILVDPEGALERRNHWEKTSHSLLVGAILHVLYAERDKTLAGVANFLSDPRRPIETTLRAMMTTKHLGDAPHPVVASAARELLNKSENERSGVLSTAMSFLALYRDPVVGKVTSRCDWRIDDLVDAERPVTLYLVVPPSDISRTKPLVRLVLNQIGRRLTEELKVRNQRLLLMLDEFPALGRLDFFESALAFMAGYGLKSFLVAQSLNQLEKAYGSNHAILDNCHVRVAFRTINGLISSVLTSNLALGAADLGLLTSIYFLTFAAAQIPIGALLDRFGPRRVQATLLLIAAIGAALFGAAQAFWALVLARAMIGLGVAAALTAGLKAIVLWFPKERVALLNGSMVMLGALGAVTATAPAEVLMDWIGWRALFELLAAATAASAVLVYIMVPEQVAPPSKGPTPLSLKSVYVNSDFWRLAPVSATCVGSAWALQGLWAAAWLSDVEGLDRPSVVAQLFVMAVALSVGGFLLGNIADQMRHRGIGPERLFVLLAGLFIAAQFALILRLPVPSSILWSLVAVAGAGTVLSYAIVAEYFPKELTGRANGALNVFHFGWAFVLQYAIGLVLQQWPSQDGHYPTSAYQVAFSCSLGLQIAALAWFELARVGRQATRHR